MKALRILLRIPGKLPPSAKVRLGGWTGAAFWIDMKTNFSVVATGPQSRARKVAGTHGYAPSHPELLASFFIAGPGIKPGLDLGQIDMRSIAPTLAQLLGLTMDTADRPPLPIRN